MTIYPDHTLIIQIINFLVLLFVLNRILYRPIRDILSERSRRISMLTQNIEDMKREIKEKEEDVRELLEQARRIGMSERENIKKQAVEYEKKLLQDTYNTVEEKLSKARNEIEEKISKIKEELKRDINIFSQELAEKVLGRKV